MNVTFPKIDGTKVLLDALRSIVAVCHGKGSDAQQLASIEILASKAIADAKRTTNGS